MDLPSYHNHTLWSDGKGTIPQMLSAAHEQGLKEIGFSDHYVLHPKGETRRWAMAPDELDAYVAEVQLHAENSRVQVKLGLEVDWFPESADAIREALSAHDFDYVIGSVHEVDGFMVDAHESDWRELTEDERHEGHCRYWDRLRSMAESKLFDIAGHIDLPKKFACLPEAVPVKEITAALDAIAAADLCIELNTSGWAKACAEAYPSLALLKECRKRSIPCVLTADAHSAPYLRRDFAKGLAWLHEAGFEEGLRFHKRKRELFALPRTC